MNINSKLWLDTNRQTLQALRAGGCKGVNVVTAREIIIKEFQPHYRGVDETSYDQVLRLFEDIYRHYDAWLIENPNWSPSAGRYGMQEANISVLDSSRPYVEEFLLSGTTRKINPDDLLRVMKLEFQPNYQLSYADPEQPAKMIRELYGLYDDRRGITPAPDVIEEKRGRGRPRKEQ